MPSLALTVLDSLPCKFRRLIDLYLSHAKRENLPPQAYTWRGIANDEYKNTNRQNDGNR
jgi:hypothetical protein